MEQTNPIKYSDLVQPDDAITDLIKQLEQLQQQYKKTADSIRNEANNVAASLNNCNSATEQGRKQTAAAATEAERLAAEQKKLAMAQSDTAKKIAELKRQQREANQIAKLTAQLNAAQKGSYNALSAQYSLNKIRINQMSQAERDAAEASEKLISKTNALYEEMKKMQEATGKHQLNVGNYGSALNGLGGILKGVGQNASGLASGLGVSGLGGAMSGMAAAGGPVLAAAAGVAALGGAMVEGIDTAKEYEKAVSTLQSITGMTKDQMAELTTQARELGASTVYSATEVLQLQTELAKLGYAKDDILNMTDSVLYFAQATGASLADASSMTGAALRMFEQDTTKTQEFVDKLAASTTKSALSFSALDTSLSQVAPVANAFGFNIEDVLALLGQLANAGFDASSAANATKNILLNLADANGKLAKAIGHPVTNLEELVQGLKDLDKSGVDLAASLELTDKESVAAFQTFLKGADDVNALKNALNDCTGTAEEMSKVMGDNLDGDIKSLGSAWDDFMIEINNGQGILRDIVQWLTEVIREIANAYKEVKVWFSDMWDKSEGFRSALVTVYEICKTNMQFIVMGLKNIAKFAWGAGEILIGAFTLDWELIKDGWNNASSAIVDQVSGAINTVVDNVKEASDIIANEKPTYTVETKVEPVEDNEATKAMKEAFAKAQAEVDAEKAKQAELAKMRTEAAKKRKAQAEKAKKEEDARYKQELSTRRSAEDAQLQLIEDEWQKRTIQTNLQYSRQIEDLKHTLDTEKNLSVVSRENINSQISALQKQLTNELIKIEEERYLKELELQKKAIELKLQSVRKGSEEEKELRLQLNELNRESELASAKDVDKKDINAKYDTSAGSIADEYLQAELAIFDAQQQLAQSEFDLLRNTETQKTQFRLKAEKERLEKILQLNELANEKMSDTEVQTVKNQIEKINNEIKAEKISARTQDIYGLFGLNLNNDEKQALNESVEFAKEALNSYMEAYTAAADAKVASAEKEIESAKSTLENELALREKGYANNVSTAQKELENAKKNQEKALKEQQKAQKLQKALDAASQASSLITATAGIWKSFAGAGPWGIAAAVAATALMWGSFAASKIKAMKMTQEEYGEGTVELLSGGSHQSGNDIDLGTKADGTQRRAEGGEFFAVINKRNSRKYRSLIPDVINALNRGDFETKFANDAGLSFNISNKTDLSDLSNNVEEIKKQGERQTIIEKNSIIIRYKNMIRKINN